MSRPDTKEKLLLAGRDMYKELWKLIDSMTEEVQAKNFNFEDRDKNLRDVITHLHEWHKILHNWVESNMAGNKKPLLPVGYDWTNYQELNMKFWEKHQETSLDKAKEMFTNSHKESMELVNKLSNEELFTKQYYDWIGATTLGSICDGCISDHYEWAMEKLNKHFKSN